MYVQSLRKYATCSFPLLDFAATFNKREALTIPETVLSMSVLKVSQDLSCHEPLNTAKTTNFYCS